MAYIAPIHRPSSVRHAVKLSFLTEGSDDLVIAKANQLEIWSANPHVPSQLELRYTRSIYGKVTILHKLSPITSSQDQLFVGTDRFNYFTLSWDDGKKELRTEMSYVDVAEKAARDSQTGDRIAVDPTNRFIALECYEGVVNILPISQAGKGKSRVADDRIGEIGDPIPIRIPELFVKSTCFLHKRPHPGGWPQDPEFALLEEDSQQNLHVKIRQLDFTRSLRPQEEPSIAELDKVTEVEGDIEIGSSHLIPLPAPMYGLLIIGETCITYVEDGQYKQSKSKPLSEATVWVSWCAIDGQRYALADDYGKLYLLFIVQNEDGSYRDHQLDQLGKTSRASTLVYLDSGRLFVGSNQGDSQVVQIVPKGLEVLQSFPGIAPVLDFTVMDMGNRSSESVINEFSSGQARIVTGSGAYQDGSLRSVRSGVGLEDLGLIGQMEAFVTALFPVSSELSSTATDTLVISFHDATRAFQFDADGQVGEIFEIDDSFTWQSQETIYAGQTQSGHTVHVGSTTVSLGRLFPADGEAPNVVQTWVPPSKDLLISHAVVTASELVLVVGENNLTVLSTAGSALSRQTSHTFESHEQISCIATSTAVPGHCFIGFWKRSEVALVDLQTLQTVATTTVADDELVIPRSLCVARILADSSPTLFVGLTDGTVATYTVESLTAPFTGRRSMIIGTQQPSFAILSRGNGQENVLASCEHPTLIYGDEGRIVYNAVTAQDSTAVCSFDCEAYPKAIAIATGEEGSLRLALVDEVRTTHVETLPVHETVRRIAYSPYLKAFALGCIKRTLVTGVEEVQSHIKLVDEVVFEELHTYNLEPDELVECVIRCRVTDWKDGLQERFVVGTAFLNDTFKDTARGRILVFDVTEARHLRLICRQDLKGACRCLAMYGEVIVAALIKTVTTFTLEYARDQYSLVRQAAYRTATAPIDLVVTDEVIAVSDLMKSLSLIKYTPSEQGDPPALVEVARHFETLWSTAAGCVAQDTFLESDAEGNLVVLQYERNSYSEEDRRRLRVTSEMQLGELVNRIRRVDVKPSSDAVVVPRAFLATVEGSIYLFALIAPGKQDLLMRMQTQMASMVKSPGNVPFNKYRGFRTAVRDMSEDGPMRFVDGSLIERFLDCDQSIQEAIIDGLNINLEDAKTMVEALKRTH